MGRSITASVAFLLLGFWIAPAPPLHAAPQETPEQVARALTRKKLARCKSKDDLRRALTRLIDARVRLEHPPHVVAVQCPPSASKASDASGAAKAPGSLRVEVIDKDGPVPGATVILDGQGKIHSFVTDEHGILVAPVVPSGGYTVMVEMAGYQAFQRQICVPAGKLAIVKAGVLAEIKEEVVVMSASASASYGAALQFAPGVTDPSITNNQVAGVDEGGIVKARPGGLLVLRRGRLFSIDLGEAGPRVVSVTPANAPGTKPASWYDELLSVGGSAVVIGYDYAARASEINVFDVDAAGMLAFRTSARVRGTDYYSAQNYASRLIGDRLILYMPVPAITRRGVSAASARLTEPEWQPVRDGEWKPLLEARDVFGPVQATEWPVYHAIVTCTLASKPLACSAQAVLAPASREFFVSGSAVYVWAGEGGWAGESREHAESVIPDDGPAPSYVYRMPLDGSTPQALGTWGSPLDQFSFHEGDDASLHVLVAAPHGSRGEDRFALALANLPLAAFSAAPRPASASMYVPLPTLPFDRIVNRFVGEWLLFGVAPYDEDVRVNTLHAQAWRTRAGTASVQLDHRIERIEPMGRAAVVIGQRGDDLGFTALALDGGVPVISDGMRFANAAEAESRSHGFFFKPAGPRDGTLGLPVIDEERGGHGEAKVTFLRVDNLHFVPLGTLDAHASRTSDDACVASCVDWYGNARPIFLGDRIFALLGYELVEGRVADGQLAETTRLDFTPPAAREESQR